MRNRVTRLKAQTIIFIFANSCLPNLMSDNNNKTRPISLRSMPSEHNKIGNIQ